MTNIDYIGDELELFKHAVNWKRYYRNAVLPFIKGDVCEVGAGLGGTTTSLLNDEVTQWYALEPDTTLSSQIKTTLETHPLKNKVTVITGTLIDVPADQLFDSIVYIDVIEHIENDKDEFRHALKHLRFGGHLVVLVPAFNYLYSPFDKAIGHFRRYDKQMFHKLSLGLPVRQVMLRYYDSMGYFASLANKLFLNKSQPSPENIRFWDGTLIPLSVNFDPMILYKFGKSLVGVWQKTEQ